MEEKLTFREKVVDVFFVLVGALIIVLFFLLFVVRFNEPVAVWAMGILDVESGQEVTMFIRWSFINLFMFLFVIVFNWDVAAQIANKSMKSMKDIWRILFARISLCVGGIGWVFFIVLLFVMFNDRVEYWAIVILGVESKRDVINLMGLSISWILGFFILVTVVRWVALQVENNMEEMNELWRRIIFWFLLFVGALGVVLFALLLAIVFVGPIEYWAKGILGISDENSKQEVIQYIGSGIAGILAFFGAIAVNRRANAQVKVAESQLGAAEAQVQTAKAQVQTADAQSKNNELIEKGHVQERFKAAVGHLGSEQVTARIASFYEFFYLARDNEDFRRNIFDILCAHLRQTTADEEYRVKIGFSDEGDNSEIRPTEEVQSLLDVLFKKDSQEKLIFERLISNLRDTYLRGVNLEYADLRNADLRNTNLQSAYLHKMDLHGANLHGADLRNAYLQNADLQKVKLWYANLQETRLVNVNLREADLWRANLQNADLRSAELREADLRDAKLQGANLQGTLLWGTNFEKADLRNADLRGVLFSEDIINLGTANLSRAKIKGVKFPEGYKPPADADTTSDD